MHINPATPGWLKQTTTFRKSNIQEIFAHKAFNSTLGATSLLDPPHNKGSVFYQSTFPDFDSWSGSEKAKVWLADSLIGLCLKNQVTSTTGTLDQLMEDSWHTIYVFYSKVYEMDKGLTRIWGIRKPYSTLVELFIEKRVSLKPHGSNPHEDFFYRALFFLDIYIFKRWLKSGKSELEIGLLRTLQDELYKYVIGAVALAASSTEAHESQKRFLELIIEKANFQERAEPFTVDAFRKNSNLETFALAKNTSFEFRYYLLEVATVTVLAKKMVGQEEIFFLEELTNELSLHRDIFCQLVVSLMELLPNPTLCWQS